ncbi:MAG: SpoIIE family protein phosphatase [Phycisphaerales bacterium]|nr:SpoIIE family protein phosphatase [Planctomycetota bacterium]MCH8508352.1 SpoIIE family protein phosphatase [Phycisphaerales bacterium]
MPDHAPNLVLQLVEGPTPEGMARRWRADPAAPLTIGRGQDVRVQLPDASVSRRHAEISFDGADWVFQDLGSRHGSVINGRELSGNAMSVLGHRDLVQVGAWVFRVLIAGHPTSMTMSMSESTPGRVRRVLPGEMGSLVKQRLDLVLGAAERLGAVSTESEIASTIVDAVLDGAGSARVALVRLNSDGLRVIACAGGAESDTLELSRSLIEEASRGQIVLLESDAPSNAYGQSIVQLGIHSAFCAPVMIGDRVEGVLYLDARGEESRTIQDAVAFVGAMARICGLALANLSRATLERAQAQLEADLSAARVAQRIMMPTPTGRIGTMKYAVLSRPGRYVAGDLIGIEPREDGRVCFFLGDVTGKGAGAAMLMGIAQSYLTASLVGDAPIEDAVNGLHGMIAARIDSGQFISLWIGEWDPASGVLRSIDAGHGYAILRSPGGECLTGFGEGGMPIGIEPDEGYRAGETPCPAGSSLLLFSDGLVEQPDARGRMFGLDRVQDIINQFSDPDELVRELEHRLTEHAAADRFDDDLTMAAFSFG